MTQHTETDTPRTDEKAHYPTAFNTPGRECVTADFARQLERELATLHVDNQALEEQRSDAMQAHSELVAIWKTQTEEVAALQARLAYAEHWEKEWKEAALVETEKCSTLRTQLDKETERASQWCDLAGMHGQSIDLLRIELAQAQNEAQQSRRLLGSLFEGGFLQAALRGEPSQWTSELEQRIAPCLEYLKSPNSAEGEPG